MSIKFKGSNIKKVPGGSPPPLDCSAAWKEIEKEKDEILKDPDPIKRNKQVTAAYAKLYNDKPEMKWSGLAALVSRQAGCAMEDAKSRTGQWVGGSDAKTAYEGLAKANKSIFEDIYPNMRFYSKYGLAGIKQCGNTPGHEVPEELKKSFELIDQGKIREGSDEIAKYEQMTVVQTKVYADPKVKETFAKNQYWANSWVSGIAGWFGARKPEIPLSPDCGGGTPVPFSGDINNPSDRVKYYESLMKELDKLSKDPKWLPNTMGTLIQRAP